MTESYPKFLKILSKLTRRLDYATIKFTSSTPSLDNAIIKLWGAHTRQWRHSVTHLLDTPCSAGTDHCRKTTTTSATSAVVWLFSSRTLSITLYILAPPTPLLNHSPSPSNSVIAS